MGTISRKLKQFRLAAGLTQEQLANELGVTRQALSNWEQGKTEPDLDMLKRICNVLQVDVRELIYEETEIKSQETGEGEIEEQEIMGEVDSRDISTISDIRGGGSTVTAESLEPLKKEMDRKQGSGTKKIILIIIVVCCIFLVSIIGCFILLFGHRIENSKQRIRSEQGGSAVSEPAYLLTIPEEKPRETSNVKAVDSETIQWFNTCMAIYLSANQLDLELYGGYEKDDMALSDAQYRLSNDWNIGSREDTYEIVKWLLGEGHRSEYEKYKQQLLNKELLNKGEHVFQEQLPKAIPEVSDNQILNRFTTVYRANKEYEEVGIDAWDYCRAIQVVSTAYYAGYYSLSEAMQQSQLIGKQLQSEYSSWEDVCGSYLYGYIFWQKEDSKNMYGPGAARRMVYEYLLKEPDNPYAANDFNKELTDTWTNAGLAMEAGDYTYKIPSSFEDITNEDDRGYEDTYRYKGDGSKKYSSNVVVSYEYYYPEQDDYMSEEAFLKYLKKAGYFISFGYNWEEDVESRASIGEGEYYYSFICTDEEWKKNGAARIAHMIHIEGKKELLLIVENHYESDNITEWKEEVQQIIDSVKYMGE